MFHSLKFKPWNRFRLLLLLRLYSLLFVYFLNLFLRITLWTLDLFSFFIYLLSLFFNWFFLWSPVLIFYLLCILIRLNSFQIGILPHKWLFFNLTCLGPGFFGSISVLLLLLDWRQLIIVATATFTSPLLQVIEQVLTLIILILLTFLLSPFFLR